MKEKNKGHFLLRINLSLITGNRIYKLTNFIINLHYSKNLHGL